MNFVAAGAAADVPSGTMVGLEVEGRGILVANVGGTFYALQRMCPHMGFDLCKGHLDGRVVTCRMHGASFDLATGEPLTKAKLLVFKTQPKPATTYPVKVDAGLIMVGL